LSAALNAHDSSRGYAVSLLHPTKYVAVCAIDSSRGCAMSFLRPTKHVAVCCSAFDSSRGHAVSVCALLSVLQCGAVCCSVLQCV